MNLPRLLWWLDLFILISGACIAVITLTVWAIRRRNPLLGAPLRPNRIGLTVVWVCLTAYFVGATAGNLLGRRLAGAMTDEAKRDVWIGILGSNAGALFALISCLLVARYAFLNGWRGLGLYRRPLIRDLIAAVLAWLASMSVCTAIAWTTQKLVERIFREFKPPEHGVFTALEDPSMPAAMKLVAFLGALLIAPVAEELLFRGILQSGARKLFPIGRRLTHRWGAVVVVGILFGGMHSTTPHHIPALAVFGIILGYLYERTGSLTLPILVHILFNAKSLIWDLLM